jgi:hypothetical protein
LVPHRSPSTVAAAWFITGPVGHLWCGIADWAGLARHYAWARLRGRDPWQEPYPPL